MKFVTRVFSYFTVIVLFTEFSGQVFCGTASQQFSLKKTSKQKTSKQKTSQPKPPKNPVLACF